MTRPSPAFAVNNRSMNKLNDINSQQPLCDEYGNLHYLASEKARGGQGVVFCSSDADLAIKLSLETGDAPDGNARLRVRFQNIRLLPLPARIPVSLPLAILRDEAGYVMRLLNGMDSFAGFDMDGKARKALEEEGAPLPPWLAGSEDTEVAWRLCHYARTGSARRRLFALARCAAILARLHAAGLVYGDISPNNAFTGPGCSRDVWLIDADNLRFERPHGGGTFFTPSYGAPEIVRCMDSSRPRSDSWAFAVMAFKLLALCHPFIGKKVLEPDDEEDDWAAEPLPNGAPTDLRERAYAGYLPFVDDEDDDSNQAQGGLPRHLVATPEMQRLFQHALGAGRTQAHRRPAMFFWARALTRAFDRSLECPACRMSYFADDHKACPYCRTPRPAFIRATTPRWQVLTADASQEFKLPHRLFHPFSLECHDDTEHEADLTRMPASPMRGTQAFPAELQFEYVQAAT